MIYELSYIKETLAIKKYRHYKKKPNRNSEAKKLK